MSHTSLSHLGCPTIGGGDRGHAGGRRRGDDCITARGWRQKVAMRIRGNWVMHGSGGSRAHEGDRGNSLPHGYLQRHTHILHGGRHGREKGRHDREKGRTVVILQVVIHL